MSPTGSIARSAGLLTICLVLGVLGAEVLARGFARFGGALGSELARRDPSSTLVVPHGERGYRQRPGSEHTYGNGARASANSAGYRGPLVSIEKPPGTFRILLLGGSATHGFGVNDAETIDASMRRQLAKRFPGLRFEVVNLALDGYDSYQVFERMRSDGLRLTPDLVIVSSGVNDVRNARFPDLKNPDPRTLIWDRPMARLRAEAEQGGPGLWSRMKQYSYLARLPGLLNERFSLWRKDRRRRAPTPHSEALDYFEANLLRTADLVHAAGAGLILSTPPSSLESRYAPEDTSPRDYWIGDASATQAYRDQLAARMDAVAERLRERGRPIARVAPELEADQFLDDCHLTPEGNDAMAERFIESMRSFLPANAAGG